MTVQEAIRRLTARQINHIFMLAHDKRPLSDRKDPSMDQKAAKIFYDDCMKELDAEEKQLGWRPEFEPVELD